VGIWGCSSLYIGDSIYMYWISLYRLSYIYRGMMLSFYMGGLSFLSIWGSIFFCRDDLISIYRGDVFSMMMVMASVGYFMGGFISYRGLK